MKTFYIFLIYFFVGHNIAESGTKHSSSISNYIDNYKKELINNKKKGAKGAIAVSKNHRLLKLIRYKKKQSYVNKLAIKNCQNRYNTDCELIYIGLKKNKKYSPVKYNSKEKYLSYKGKKAMVDKWFEYGDIKVFKKVNDTIFGDFACAEFPISKHTQRIKDIVYFTIKSFPKDFLNNSGLKYVLICGDTLSHRVGRVGGLALGGPIDTSGFFVVSMNLHNLFDRDEKIIKRQKDNYEYCKRDQDLKDEYFIENIKIDCEERKKSYMKKLKGHRNEFLEIFSHELYHIIDDHTGFGWEDPIWKYLNEHNYIDYFKRNKNDAPVKGFVTLYAQSNVMEDKAELFEKMVTSRKWLKAKLKTDEILLEKSKIMIRRLKKIYPKLSNNFWSEFDKVQNLKGLGW